MRWIALHEPSPSGKTQFVCRCCGVITTAPGKGCSVSPKLPKWHRYYGLSCAEIDARDDVKLASDLQHAESFQSDVLASLLFDIVQEAAKSKKASVRNAAREKVGRLVRCDRLDVAGILSRATHQALDSEDKRIQWDVWFIIDQIREELKVI